MPAEHIYLEDDDCSKEPLLLLSVAACTMSRQWLVRFQDKTQVLDIPLPAAAETDVETAEYLLNEWSLRTGWPVSCLQVQSVSWPFMSLGVRSSVRGGKGGFGTLLKGQSRQAGAKLTIDFGACRDLQGRRLRHVNDEIKLRKWREIQQQKGDSSDAKAAMFDTPSGLYNWHLMVPNWADISKKGTRKIQRQFERLQREQGRAKEAKREKQAQHERSVANYVNQAAEASRQAQSGVLSAIQQGLQVQHERKRKRQEKPQQFLDGDNDNERPNSLCTLSGDVVVEEKTVRQDKGGASKSIFQIQSQSDFATLVLFLDKRVPTSSDDEKVVLYYEVRLVTGGLAQLGWADMTTNEFHPNTEQGEGVGDDAGSYAYDGSRSLKFHNGTEEIYGSKCKASDVVGCLYNVTSGDISYSINGTDLGTAFSVQPGTIMLPALSCNGGEILELHIGADDMEHLPNASDGTTILPVKDLVVVGITSSSDDHGESNFPHDGDDDDKKPEANPTMHKTDDENTHAESPVGEEKTSSPKPSLLPENKNPIKVEPVDLNKYDSAEELEKLGLDRLKGALMAMGVKCGGSLSERAARLLSLKGLERKDFPAKVRAKTFVV